MDAEFQLAREEEKEQDSEKDDVKITVKNKETPTCVCTVYVVVKLYFNNLMKKYTEILSVQRLSCLHCIFSQK